MPRPKTITTPRTVIAPRIDSGILLQFDAAARARGVSRNEALEAAMRQWMNGKSIPLDRPKVDVVIPSVGANEPRPRGYDAISGAPIY